MKKIKILLIIEQCNPNWSSVPLVGFNFYQEISTFTEVTLVTHERNKKSLEEKKLTDDIHYINESDRSKKIYKISKFLSTYKGRTNWPLAHTLSYPIYEEFNSKVYKLFFQAVSQEAYDIVHVITPMMPRYPYKIVEACKNTPFIIGPVNGGVPFPSGFREVARQEFVQFNFLRKLGRKLIPGYQKTYQNADKILVGSTYTLNMLKEMFSISDDKLSLFYENGVSENFFEKSNNLSSRKNQINLLFVGRLVPYKGADMLIEAISNLEEAIRNKIKLTIVGDGSEKDFLKEKVEDLKLDQVIKFVGWVSQENTLEYYNAADIFCFPSVREFGGAVVLEAMASGLPCIVVNNGGIGEYVTENTGFRIEPISREYVIAQLKEKIVLLINNQELRQEMSLHSQERAEEFKWSNKGAAILEMYKQVLENKS